MRAFASIISVLLFCFMMSQVLAADTLYKVGDSGKEIRLLQENLIDLGYPVYKADGVFDATTYFIVRIFQREHKLKVTGIVDKEGIQSNNEG